MPKWVFDQPLTSCLIMLSFLAKLNVFVPLKLDSQFLYNNSINLMILALEALKPEGERFVSIQCDIRRDNDGPVICVCEASMLFNSVRIHG